MLINGSKPAERTRCVHDSTRLDGTLDCNCLLCGADGYWHAGHRHDKDHPSGKTLFHLACPEARRRTPPSTPAPGYESLPPGWRPQRSRS